jgi:macrolide transport system ATP-binding/permease protein
LPVSFNGNTDWIRFVGRPYSGEHNEVNQREVSIGYFDTIGAKLLQGRKFTEADEQQGRRVVIINRRLATQYFPGEDPVGKQIGDTMLTPASLKEIIGVVDNIHEGSLDAEIWPAVYYPFHMDPSTSYSLVVRTLQDAGTMLGPIRAAIRKLHPDVGMMDEITMEQRIRMSPTACLHRSAAWLVGGFAGLALLVGVVGLYGVVAYAVSQRTREIGVRMALGAAPITVYRLILREAAVLAGTAAVLGLAGSLAASRLMRGLFYGVGSWDAPLLAVVTAVLIGAAMLASYLPARRAALVNPVEALRAE